MKEAVQKKLEGYFEEVVRETFEKYPPKGTPFDSLPVLEAIGNLAEGLKKEFLVSAFKDIMTEAEIRNLIDEVSSKIIEKYFETNNARSRQESDYYDYLG